MQGMFLGKTHRAVNLMADSSHLACGFAASRLGDCNGKTIVAEALGFEQHIRGCGGSGEMAGRYREHVLHGLEFPDRPTELHPLIGIAQRVVHAALHAADQLLHPHGRAECHQSIDIKIIRRGAEILRRQRHAVEMHFVTRLVGDVAAGLVGAGSRWNRAAEESLAASIARERQRG